MKLLLCILLCVLFLCSVQGGDDGETVIESSYSCDGCKFFPSVCDNIDNCIDHCNIAPTMRDSCNEMIVSANQRGSANEDL
jgi:hypothetical protein